jgi:hypothetical protein
LTDPILSRFDILCVVKDEIDEIEETDNSAQNTGQGYRFPVSVTWSSDIGHKQQLRTGLARFFVTKEWREGR